MTNPLSGWHVDRNAIGYLGNDLQRPECVLAERNGSLWCSDARGGVMRLHHDGSQQLLKSTNRSPHALVPNGMAIAPNGEFVLANWQGGSIERMTRSGQVSLLCTEIDGVALGTANFVLQDADRNIWFTITTREEPWTRQLQTRASDGYIGVIDAKGARIVADGFCGTNEIRFDAQQEWLYVVETTGRRISRLRVLPAGKLGHREVFGPAVLPGFPDGIAFDVAGNLWATLTIADRLIALTPDGELLTLLDDGDASAHAQVMREFEAGTLAADLMLATHGSIAPWMASIAFGGPDLRTVYLGSVLGTRLPYFRSPVAGLSLAHWGSTGGG